MNPRPRFEVRGVGSASAAEIDDLGIAPASFLAMRRALDALAASGPRVDFVLVDGKQRIESVRMFMRDELPVFGGHVASDFDYLDTLTCHFKWHVNELATRAEVLKWYLDLNSGGVVHTDDELDRVRGLLEAEKSGEVR